MIRTVLPVLLPLLLPLMIVLAPPAARAADAEAGPPSSGVAAEARQSAAAAAPSAAGEPAPITAANLYENERDWPYHVTLTEAWKPDGFEGETFAWGEGSVGVLLRVEPDGTLLVDFGRFGRYTVPIEATRTVRDANDIRSGTRTKGLPNFVMALVNKLVDPHAEPIAYASPDSVRDVDGFLLVVADPTDEGFGALVESIAPLAARPDVEPVLFPLGGHPDGRVVARCREAGFDGLFAHSRFTDAYRESIFGPGSDAPRVLLQSPEGRLMYGAAWSDAVPEALAEAVGRELGPGPGAHVAGSAERAAGGPAPAS